MADISVREIIEAEGMPGEDSLLRGLFGFQRGRVPTDPSGAAVEVSLRQHMNLLFGPHIHLNIFAVGQDNFHAQDYADIDYAIHRTRAIYLRVGLGVGGVHHDGVDAVDAEGLDMPTSRSELKEITRTWTVMNDGIDVFIPFAMDVATDDGILLGLSVFTGPCPPGSLGGKGHNDRVMEGSVVGIWNPERLAWVLAHEIGHYLGLIHNRIDEHNLMFPTLNGADPRNSIGLGTSQVNHIKRHCMVTQLL